MTKPTPSTIAIRGLAGELRTLRQGRKLSVRGVAARLGWPASKLSRMETGRQGSKLEDVASLLVIYGVTGEERQRLLAMSERSEPGWWEVLGGLPVESRTLIQLEAEASAIVDFEPLLVPGLLQTPDYTRAVLQGCGVPEADAQTRVTARLGRQAILARSEPPALHAILDESALRRPLGGPWVMGRQLRHLVDAADRPNVTLQVVPWSVGGYTGLDGAFAILDFPRNRTVVHLEHKISGLFLEEPEQVSFFREELDRLLTVALSPAESIDLVARLAGEHERERGEDGRSRTA
ncbi:helix-turn-helix transcriptional regulator [Solwaraspora sp. WMMA2065]|uniref:helix-turn-helix domain-containing protein n=1 Tax=Solwaraspora sp. WMMA2065 TaxID=3015166 RepID=UPI00259BD242|nr:helix-turn-helix transcriptional regulator [Solwaraspora sp. WMMA2065]WJK34535.1 helix-turn-helix transcriptional regulator [Solwaraspora sp. WMMA2065]